MFKRPNQPDLTRKTFVHRPLDLETYDRVVIDGVRHYDTPIGPLKSVTSVLAEKSDNEWIEKWHARVGKDTADRILTQAGRRGTAIHELAEKYLMNDPNWFLGAMPVNQFTFNTIRPYIDKHVDVVYGVEKVLYSKELLSAGTSDLIAQWDEVDSIIDFKTSRSNWKTEDDIVNYFVQMTAYSIMLEERTGRVHDRIVIVMAVDHDKPKIFVKDRREYLGLTREIFTGR